MPPRLVLSSVVHVPGRGPAHASRVYAYETRPSSILAVCGLLAVPVMDGFEATRIIKETYFLETVVALTADESFDVREKCEAIGFDDFATKPLQWDGLAALLEKHTGHVVKPVVGAVIEPQDEGKQGGRKPYDANYAELPASAGA